MTEPHSTELPAEHLPLIGDVVAVLKMCVDHDIPLDKLPRLWDEHQQLQQVERRAGIQNGNMDREIKRLRQLTGELDKQVKDGELTLQELQDKYDALLSRCKHFEGLANARRIEDLEDLVAHYRCGMNGMKEIANNCHFSNELRLYLVRTCLYTFEPELKEATANA